MEILFGIIGIIIGLGPLICWGWVLVEMSADDGFCCAILGFLFFPFAFIWGWWKVRERGLGVVMTIWTIYVIVATLSCGAMFMMVPQ